MNKNKTTVPKSINNNNNRFSGIGLTYFFKNKPQYLNIILMLLEKNHGLSTGKEFYENFWLSLEESK